jgi:hypothetical protein
MAMTDWSKALASAMQRHVEQGGSCGSSGSAHKTSNRYAHLRVASTGTTTPEQVVPVVPDGGAGTTGTTLSRRVVPGPAEQECKPRQGVSASGTTGTTRTTEYEASRAAEPEDGSFEERAALIEIGSDVPRAWAEGFARLDPGRVPSGFSEARWRRLIDDGGRFLDDWGPTAAELGWSARDVFGLHADEPTLRLDAMGLAALIDGGVVVAVTTVSATIRAASGHELVYLRRASAEALVAWELPQ